MSLNTMTTRFFIIVTLKGANKADLVTYKGKLKIGLDGLPNPRYAFILHDRDFNADGQLESPHIHLYLQIAKKKRIVTMINAISKWLDVSPFAVSVQDASSEVSCVQYLIHKRDKDKFQYPKEELIHNYPLGELDLVLTAEEDEFNLDYVCRVCKESDTLVDVMRRIGMSRYHGYRNTILDIWHTYHG